jgi:two-component system, NarL family, nitrate/nitrite response regulator NarL
VPRYSDREGEQEETGMDRIRVFVVHEERSTANHTASALAQYHGIRVVDQASSVLEAQARLGKGVCDIVLVSATLPNEGSLTLARAVRSNCAPTKVIVTGIPHDTRLILRSIAAGVSGYTLEDEGTHIWRDRIFAVYNGKAAVSPTVAATMMVHLTKLSKLTARYDPRPIAYTSLTEREQEILDMLGQGRSNQEIAERLVIGHGTVKNHVHSVLRKLNLRSRKDAESFLSLVSGERAPAQTAYTRPSGLLNQ